MKSFAKLLNLYLLVISCSLYIACPKPPSGELEPILVDGATLTTSRFENDTLLFSENGLKVKFYGNWEGSTGLRVAIQNKTDKDVFIRFDEFIALNGNGKRARIGDITVNDNGKFTYLRHSRIGNSDNEEDPPKVKVAVGTQYQFEIVFSNLFSYGKDEKANTIYLTLPVEISGDTTIAKELKPVFKIIERKTKDMREPEAW